MPEPVRLTVASLFAALRASDPGRPRLTWYGADGERVELSARVLENWVAKTANLMVDELDAGPGTRVCLDLPPHWRHGVWALAAWAVGAVVVSTDGGDVDGGADILVTTPQPPVNSPVQGSRHLVVVDLGALAWSAASAGPLPPGATDYNAEVAGFGDDLPPSPPAAAPGASLDALLADVAARGLAWTTSVPLVEHAADYDPAASLLAPLAVDASLVLLGPGAPDAERVAAQERGVLRRPRR